MLANKINILKWGVHKHIGNSLDPILLRVGKFRSRAVRFRQSVSQVNFSDNTPRLILDNQLPDSCTGVCFWVKCFSHTCNTHSVWRITKIHHIIYRSYGKQLLMNSYGQQSYRYSHTKTIYIYLRTLNVNSQSVFQVVILKSHLKISVTFWKRYFVKTKDGVLYEINDEILRGRDQNPGPLKGRPYHQQR